MAHGASLCVRLFRYTLVIVTRFFVLEKSSELLSRGVVWTRGSLVGGQIRERQSQERLVTLLRDGQSSEVGSEQGPWPRFKRSGHSKVYCRAQGTAFTIL